MECKKAALTWIFPISSIKIFKKYLYTVFGVLAAFWFSPFEKRFSSLDSRYRLSDSGARAAFIYILIYIFRQNVSPA